MSNPASLERRIAKLLLERMSLDVPSPQTDLIKAGFLDSMALVELLSHLEREFDRRIQIDELEIESFRTIARIAAFVAGDVAVDSARAGG